jgi:hypothetical protein
MSQKERPEIAAAFRFPDSSAEKKGKQPPRTRFYAHFPGISDSTTSRFGYSHDVAILH